MAAGVRPGWACRGEPRGSGSRAQRAAEGVTKPAQPRARLAERGGVPTPSPLQACRRVCDTRCASPTSKAEARPARRSCARGLNTCFCAAPVPQLDLKERTSHYTRTQTRASPRARVQRAAASATKSWRRVRCPLRRSSQCRSRPRTRSRTHPRQQAPWLLHETARRLRRVGSVHALAVRYPKTTVSRQNAPDRRWTAPCMDDV